MKDLKAFLEVMGKNEKLSEKVRGAKDVKEMVKIAKNEGYAVTENEMNEFLMEAVAGGSVLDAVFAGIYGVTAAAQTKSKGGTWGSALMTGIGTGIQSYKGSEANGNGAEGNGTEGNETNQ